MKLYYKPGACSMASHMILNTIDIDFDIEKVNNDMNTTETGADFTQINPKKYVPLLELDDGQTLSENTAILTYLGKLKPEYKLFPDDDISFYRVLEDLSFISSELHKSFTPFFHAQPFTKEAEQAAHQLLDKNMRHLDTRLSDGRRYLHGDQIDVSDFYFFVVANWANILGFGLNRWSYIKDYVDNMMSLPAVQQTLQAEGLAGHA